MTSKPISTAFEPVDTSPEMERRYRHSLLARVAADRVKMASSMYQTAKATVIAGLGKQASRQEIFRRMYGRDFEPAVLAVIENAIRKYHGRTTGVTIE